LNAVTALPIGSEPHATALLLAAFAVLVGASVILSRASGRFGLPVMLVFLGFGMLAGSEGVGRIPFEDYGAAYRLGTIALVLILFDGGLNTPLEALRRFAAPAGLLASVGVVLTALLVAVLAHGLGHAWPVAMVLGAVVSSTDAAAVFAALRGSRLQLKRRVGVTLEIESGLNDPVAVILTVVLSQNLLAERGFAFGWTTAGAIVWQMIAGALCGVGVGFGGRWLLGRVRLPAGGLYPVLTLALACLAFGITTLAEGSGFLAVYLAAVALGNSKLPYRNGVLRVHDTLAWLGQVVMFLVLGLLVFPSRLVAVAGDGLLIALGLAFVARPLAVALCLVPFRAAGFGYTVREIAYIAWVGLRGAVPIILAVTPVLLGARGGTRLFDLVCVIVVVNAFIPGATVRWMTGRLGLASEEPPSAPAVLDIESREPLVGDLLSFYVDEALAVAGVPLSELPFPSGAAATLVVRGRQLIAPKGSTVLTPGDHVYVLTSPDDRALVELLFGRPEEDA